MPVRKGTVSGSVSTVSFNIPTEVISFYLTNKTNAEQIVQVYVAAPDGDTRILDLAVVSGKVWTYDSPIIMAAGYYFIIVSSGEIDYYFNIT